MRILDKEDNNKRVNLFIIFLSFIFFLLIARLYFLQIVKGEEYDNKASRNGLRSNIIKPVRGRIYDKNGVLLATNTTGYYLVHKNSQNISEEEVKLLKSMYNKNEFEINNILSKSSEKTRKKLMELYNDILEMIKISGQEYDDVVDIFYKVLPEGFEKTIIIAEDLNPKVAFVNVEKITNNRIDIVEYNKRYYPNNELASHVIGNVKLINQKEYDNLKDKGYEKNDLIGKDGIEKNYDEIMKGKSGNEYVEVDARGNILNRLDEEKPTPGKNIYLSIDYELQKYMTEKFTGELGTFIAVDIKTGKILTYVSYPEIDLNLLSSRISKATWDGLLNSTRKPLLNRGIAGLFPPGSTAKVASGAAILESGISPEATINSTGEFTYGKVTFRDAHRGGYGITNFYKAISDSVNTYFYNNILKVGLNNFLEIAKRFGIGELTEIDIPGELTGVLPTPEWKKTKFADPRSQKWLTGDLINMSIGQGYMLMTPIQVFMMYQAIANNGDMLKPSFVDYFESQEGVKEYKETEKLRNLGIKQSTIEALRRGLRQTVTNGTAKSLSKLKVSVSAKTGTAQNSNGLDHSWMAGYFPSENPEIAFVALVENGGYGSLEAGNRVYDFIQKYYSKDVVKEVVNEK